MEKLYKWFVYSSKNPQNLSLTLKGILSVLVIFGIGNSDLNEQIADLGVEFLVKAGEIASIVVTVYGFVRKLWKTV